MKNRRLEEQCSQQQAQLQHVSMMSAYAMGAIPSQQALPFQSSASTMMRFQPQQFMPSPLVTRNVEIQEVEEDSVESITIPSNI